MGGRGAKSGSGPSDKRKPDRRILTEKENITSEEHKARLKASPDPEAGKKPYADSRRQAWRNISQDELDEGNAIMTKTFIMPGNTFGNLKPGSRIEYAPMLRQGSEMKAIRGTLEVIDGIRVGISTNGKGYANYTVTDLYTGIAIGFGDTKAQAIEDVRTSMERNGGTAAFIRKRITLLENINGHAKRWKE